ncbi:hypothetical protein DL766_007942 [Monosporascus sp. MC13-8B]|uniref:Catechol O-methyltransferase n=1 Tax=Monosporascus cannonballus TaxID=155416 RepID=A0ABY0GTP1_9PEZI|nr:hypothetical protein DL762_009322 [Monosporascus cannonballus]RYO81357.1 hypothetical protein DL763_008607 [Monosporascus cannonballus]RYP21433.1 hypothetical protein DL766_007942 [Monosporascus sp. MC13-8B]
MKHETFQGEAYQPQGDIYVINDGRKTALLHFAYNRPKIERMRGNPEEVLEAIDEYARTQKYLMNIGPYKSRTVVDLIKREKLRVMVELGGYVGYSAIAFGAALREAGGKHSDSLRRLQVEGKLGRIDLLFLDHYKPAYTMDLKLCEELGLVGPGSVYAADSAGKSPYLEYVRSTVQQKRRSSRNTDGAPPKGNPNLVYESEFIEGREPSGVPDAPEITRCIRAEE